MSTMYVIRSRKDLKTGFILFSIHALAVCSIGPHVFHTRNMLSTSESTSNAVVELTITNRVNRYRGLKFYTDSVPVIGFLYSLR